nr:hypothetical protein [Tanacetum cinerariifolium]
MKLIGDETEIVPLYYHMFDNFQIQFGRKEFCLVNWLKFRVEYWADYNDEDEPIPFRRHVFPSSLDGPNDYYTRHKRYPRVAAWSSNKKFYRHMLCDFLHRRVPTKRLIPDEIEAGSGWWDSSKAHFDGREALNEEACLEEQILSLMRRFADRFTNCRPEINRLMILNDHPLIEYGRYALGCMTGADMKNVAYLKSVRDELLRSMEKSDN